MSPRTHRIAVIPGDGIGQEVMPEALRVLAAVQRKFGVSLDLVPIDWASCAHYEKTGQMMPDDWKQQLQPMDALLFGAVGWPAASRATSTFSSCARTPRASTPTSAA